MTRDEAELAALQKARLGHLEYTKIEFFEETDAPPWAGQARGWRPAPRPGGRVSAHMPIPTKPPGYNGMMPPVIPG
jgi:hypothetical protein